MEESNSGGQAIVGSKPPADYPARIRKLRVSFGLTQQSLAERLTVSFATVNRWENGQTVPSLLSWKQLRQLEESLVRDEPQVENGDQPSSVQPDFTAPPEHVKLLVEGERLSFGHLVNPAFAAETSRIDPLPHQRIAVYGRMLTRPRLRFLLADDAGAGKTIMTGLYIREMLSRRLLQRVLVVSPAGLVGNWQRELQSLFSLPFCIVSGVDARNENPFAGDAGNQLIVSIDTLASPRVFARLQAAEVLPYDLVVFDEAHKLSADRGADLRVRKTDRYRLAEALAGVQASDDRWRLGWRAHHLLLLTATPHMGKDYPYFALWRLLEPEIFSTPEAFARFPACRRQDHFLRRTKEEMVHLDGRPLYPKRISDTLGYALNQGEASEQALYEETTEYLRYVYNQAKLLNREAARLAMSVFQRRLASSTWALLRSFERRIEKLNRLIADIQDGRLTAEQLVTYQQRIRQEEDVFEAKTADDEAAEEGVEENEAAEDRLLQGVVASSLADLLAERKRVRRLLDLAKQVYETGRESKFERMREILVDPTYSREKLIVFTEHRDTLDFLVRRLNGMGYTGQVAQIHGGMPFSQREEEVEHFRKPAEGGGARFLVCTDAAGEGINLQFCWIMINYDIPWNPARLEQRMGRIHRYGQGHDPVIILNLVTPSTREGKVLKTLLEKLERIRKELRSDKVFDCVGRIFEGVSIRQYMEAAVTGDAEEAAQAIEGRLTAEQLQALSARERALYGSGGEVRRELPRLRQDLDREVYFRLIPGYVRQYVQQAAPLVHLETEGDLDGFFSFRPKRRKAMDFLLPALELYPETIRGKLSFYRPEERGGAVWLHPGEPVFERFRASVSGLLAEDGKRGALFIDPGCERPYLFHLALVSVIRKADPEFPGLDAEETLDCRLVGVRQYEGTDVESCPVEHLLLLKGGHGLPASAQRLALRAGEERELARAYLVERLVREMAAEWRNRLQKDLEERAGFLRRGFDCREAELAALRTIHSQKARGGSAKALEALEEVKKQQKELASRRSEALAALRREPELVAPGTVSFIAHALVVPSIHSTDREEYQADVERVAMHLARAYEEAAGARVLDVHTRELARAAGLPDHPGFDLLSMFPGGEKRAIEVKGRAGTGEIEVTANEWAKACNLRESYWLYAAYDCATPAPNLVRVRDPFARLLARAKGSMLIGAKAVQEATERL